MEEKRKSVRIKKALTVLYTLDSEAYNKKWDMTTIKDISDSGMCVTTGEQFSPEKILIFRMKIPSRPFEWLEIKGKVVASDELKTVSDKVVAGVHTVRIQFIDLEEEQKKLIQEYISWFLKK